MLAPPDARAAEELKARLLHRGVPLVDLVVFGSRARGDHQPDSDLDVCLVLERVDDEILNAISELAWEVGFEQERVIVTVEYTRDQLTSSPLRVSPLVLAIQAEGVRV